MFHDRGGLIENPGREEDALVSLADWYATFLELAGIPERKTSGFSLVPFLKNQPVENWRKECYTQSNGNEVYGIQRAVWNDKWKYVFNAFDYDELYDLEKDPGELHNLLHGISDFEIPASPWGPVVKEMWKKLWQFAKEHQDTCVNPYIMTAFAPYGPGILEED